MNNELSRETADALLLMLALGSTTILEFIHSKCCCSSCSSVQPSCLMVAVFPEHWAFMSYLKKPFFSRIPLDVPLVPLAGLPPSLPFISQQRDRWRGSWPTFSLPEKCCDHSRGQRTTTSPSQNFPVLGKLASLVVGEMLKWLVKPTEVCVSALLPLTKP